MRACPTRTVRSSGECSAGKRRDDGVTLLTRARSVEHNLVRVSVGLEDIEDLIADLDHGLEGLQLA